VVPWSPSMKTVGFIGILDAMPQIVGQRLRS
jgi:hypothetical protein